MPIPPESTGEEVWRRPWESPGWIERITAWVTDRLGQAGLHARGGLAPVQTRLWSTVWQIPTSIGRLYFKASAAALAYEAGLHRALFAVHPQAVPSLIAADLEQGWILMQEAGPTLRGRISQPADLGVWAGALATFVELQHRWVGRTDELLELGVLDRRLASMPDSLAELLEDETSLGLDQPGGLRRAERQSLADSLPSWREVCHQLGELGLPETLHHDDLHDANVFAGEGGPIFGDWGEACLATPLITPMIGLRSLGWRLGLPDDSPALVDLRRGYLSAWFNSQPPAVMDAAYLRALPIAALSRALTWRRALEGVPYEHRGEDAAAPAEWLRQALDWLQTGSQAASRQWS